MKQNTQSIYIKRFTIVYLYDVIINITSNFTIH